MKCEIVEIIILMVTACSAFIVKIENGKIEGKEHENYFGFRGIPYAEAERFSLPRPYSDKWNDVRRYEEYGPLCAQYEHFTYGFMGDENCLSLNVFVPKELKDSVKLAPVIVYIHGGAFMFGGSLYYGPENIMNDGRMILVTINYRLGILGFLSTEDEALPGNLGLKDQVEALKWVQKNIHAFNGDSKRVTIVGYSAGGASVHLHYMSKLSDGLFNNGISHSGVATNAWVIMENGREKAHKVAEIAGCLYDDHQEMIKCLKQKPVEELTVIAKNFQPFLYNPFSPFGVVVENEDDNAFITEHPKEILESGNFKKLPWLLSQVKDEGTYPSGEFYKDEKTLEEIDKNWNKLAPHILDFDGLTKDATLKEKASDVIRNFYMNNKGINRENFQKFNDIITDRLFKSDAGTAFKIQSKFSSSFMYFFNYKSLSGLGEYMANTTDNFSISHGEDVLLIFPCEIRTLPYSDEEQEMIKNLIGIYYSFATTDVPTFNGLEIQKSFFDKIKYLIIVSNIDYKMVQVEDFGNSIFWEHIEFLLKGKKTLSDEL